MAYVHKWDRYNMTPRLQDKVKKPQHSNISPTHRHPFR